MNENETKKLSRTDLFSMAIGQIIGVGIMTMTGNNLQMKVYTY